LPNIERFAWADIEPDFLLDFPSKMSINILSEGHSATGHFPKPGVVRVISSFLNDEQVPSIDDEGLLREEKLSLQHFLTSSLI
jgi:hypothetical protein